MKTVAICGSVRFREEILEFSRKLREKGVVVLTPFLYKNPAIFELDREIQKFVFLGLTLHHFEFIRKADVVFIFNKDGYIGNSVTLELGVAAGLGKVIYALEEDNGEQARNVLFDEIIPSPEELFERLK